MSIPSSQAMEVPSLDGLAISQDPEAIKAAKELKAKEEEKAKQEKKALKIALELENIAKLSAHDIQEQFKTSHKFKEFQYKVWAAAFLLKLPADSGAQIFARDIVPSDKKYDVGGAKTFCISTAKVIYRRSDSALTNGKPEMFYEWAGENMKVGDTTVKAGVDLDMTGVDVTRAFNEDIVWIAEFINRAIAERYEVEVPLAQWVVLKCDYDPVKRKHSAHLILDGFMWPTIAARKEFLKGTGLVEEFAKRCPEADEPSKVVDEGVFGVKFLRLFKSTKVSKTLPLWAASLPGMMVPTKDLAFFQKSMTTYTVGCKLLEDPPGYKAACSAPVCSTRTSHRATRNVGAAHLPSSTDNSNIKRYAPCFEVLEKLVTSLDENKRFASGSHDAWVELGFAVVNVGRTGGYEERAKKLFHDLSRAFPLLYKEDEVSNLLDGAKDHSNRKGWTHLKNCLLEDNPSRYKEMFGVSTTLDMALPSTSQVAFANRSKQNDVSVIGSDVRFETSLNDLANFCANFNEMKSQLEAGLGFRNISLLQAREAGFNFDADRQCKCPLCAVATHGSDAYYCLEVMPKVFVIRNYANSCKQHTLGWDEHRQLQDLMLTPDSDASYVDLFEAHFKERLKWTGKHFLFFRDHLWRPIPTEEVYNTISSMARIVLERILHHFNQKSMELDVQDGDKAAKKKNKECYNNMLKGLKYIKRNSNVRGMVEMTKNRLISDVENTMNQNPYLLGTENGIIELEAGKIHLRDGRPEDNISKTVQYEYFNAERPFDETVWDTFIEFIERIYPVDEDREVVQRYFGYCLLGHHPEKKMCLLTDARSGYNGKSTVTKALRSALGEQYSIKAAPELLYKTDCSSATINSHISGLLDFRGVRMAMIEELDAKKQLNNALLKDLNGGNSSLRGRECGQAKVNTMQWVTKMIMSFNNQCMPNFDYTDPALLTRFLIIQHRSRFFVDDEEFEANKDIPYSYRADPNIDKLITEWRPYMLKWCLIGLESYHTHGFRTVPKSCEDWKKQLVSKQDLVAEFVSERLVRTGVQTDYVHRVDLFSQFCLAYNDEQKDAKTQIKKKVFYPHINKLLGENCRKNKHENFYDSYMGWKFIKRVEAKNTFACSASM